MIVRPSTLPPSALWLVGANLVPLVGVLLLGWDLGSVMLLFWAENVAIGAWTLAKLVLLGGPWRARAVFFVVHFGIFTTVHGVFVVTIFVQSPTFTPTANGFRVEGAGPWLPTLGEIAPGLLAIFASHGASFHRNFLRGPERDAMRARAPGAAMAAPYARVVVLHVTILATGFLVLRWGSPVWALVVLVALKTTVDLGAHVWERARLAR